MADIELSDNFLKVLGHSEVYSLRGKSKTKGEQNVLGPYEHRAFARELVAENPLYAASLTVATPLYTAGKAIGAIKARSDASFEEIKQSYIGIGEGLRNFLQTKASLTSEVDSETDVNPN